MKTSSIKFWVSIISMLAAATFWIFDITDIPPLFDDWRWASLVCFVIYSGLMWWQLWVSQEEHYSKTPNIQFVNWEIIPNVKMVRTRPSKISLNKQYSATESGIFVHAVFANNPKRRTPENTANNVSAKITYYNSEDHPMIDDTFFGSFYGRWSDSDEPKTSNDTVRLINTNILSNGTPRKLDLFMKFPDDEFCYAYNNDSYFFENWRHVNYKLTGDLFYIKVELIGERVNEHFWFTVHTENKGKHIRLTEGKNKSRRD